MREPEHERPWHPEELARDRYSLRQLAEAYDADPATPAADEPWELYDLADDDDAPDPADRRGRRIAGGAVELAFKVTEMRAIARVCRDQYGLTIKEAAGWTTRGRTWATFKPDYVVDHHTATTIDIDRVLIEGRPDLPGPICQWAAHLDGVIVLIAAGLANHTGQAAPATNPTAYGIEATGPIPIGNTGADAFPQYQAYATLNAAHRLMRGWPSSRQLGHKEICIPAGRKVDPMFDMAAFRARTASLMEAAPELTPGLPKETDMFVLRCDPTSEQPARPLRLVSAQRFREINNNERGLLLDAGVPEYNLTGHPVMYDRVLELAAELPEPTPTG